MEATWQTSIDRTLRSTEATLENLQLRRSSYDRAKHKVDDYLGLTTPNRDGGGFDSLDRADLSVPPPLPRHRRYQSTRDKLLDSSDAGYASPSSGPSPGMQGENRAAFPPQPTQPSSSAVLYGSGRRGNGASARDDPTAPLQLVNAQVRGALLELELEKAKRADSIRELAYRTTAELAELRSIVTQLQGENAALRTSVKALEGKLGYASELRHGNIAGAGNTSAGHASFSELTASPLPQHQQQQQQPSRAALLASAVSNSGFALPTNHAGGGASASLVARVDALESGMARQQQLNDDRQTRTATLLREMVKAEIAADVAAMRTVAREAARDSTEELLKLRLSAIQSGVQTEVQRALRAASASETLAQQAQLQCGEVEHRLNTQLQKLNSQLLEWQRGAAAPFSTSAGSVVPFAGHGHQERQQQQQHERVVEDELHALRGQLRQFQQDTESRLQRLAQEQQQAHTQLQLKVSADDLRGLADRVEGLQRGSGGAALREQITTVLRPQIQPVVDALRKVQESAQEQQEAAEAWRRQAGLRFAAADASAKEVRDEVDRQEQQWSGCVKEVRQARAEASAVQLNTTDAIRQLKADLTEAFEAKLLAVEARAQAARKDSQQQFEGQLRAVQQSAAEQQEAMQRSRHASDALEERVRRTEAAVIATESASTHSVEAIKSKCDALGSVVQQTCTLPLTRVQQDVEAVQRRLQGLDEDRTRANAVWTQQLSEARHFLEEHVRNAREMLEQRLAHQKELCEELRGQQSAQRRYAEEQQQQTLEQIIRLQLQVQQQHQQQQQQQQPTPAVPMAIQVRSVSEDPTSAAAPAADTTSSDVPATSTALHALEHQLQLLSPRLQSVEARAAAAEKVTADAIAPLRRGLEELQAQLAEDRREQQQLRTSMEHAVEEQAQRSMAACEKVAASAREELQRIEKNLAASSAPAQVARCLCSDEDGLQQLSLHLRDHLHLPANATETLAALQAQTSQLITNLEELQSAVRETQQQVTVAMSEAAAERGAPAAADSIMEESGDGGNPSRNVADLRAELQAIQERQEALQQRHAALEADTRQLTTVQLPALTTAIDVLSTTAQPLPPQLQQLTEQVTALQATQRQQLPTLQKYVQDVLEVVQEGQSAALDPLLMKLRAVEDRQKKALVDVEERVAAQATAVEAAGLDQQKKLEQMQRDWEARTTAQLNAFEQRVTTTDASVAVALQKVEVLEGHQRDVEDAVEEVRAMAVAVVDRQSASSAAAAAPVESSPAVVAAAARTLPDSADVADAATDVATLPLAQLQSYVAELDTRLSLLEEQTSDSAAVTTDALGAFGQQLQDVVARFAATVERGSEAPNASASDATALLVTSDSGVIANLEDVFAYFLRQLQQLQRALYRLQANTVETLEILEQHEESLAALPMLQHTVDAIAAALVPLAERLGVEATTFSFPPDALDHHADVYPPSRDGSESTLEER